METFRKNKEPEGDRPQKVRRRWIAALVGSAFGGCGVGIFVSRYACRGRHRAESRRKPAEARRKLVG